MSSNLHCPICAQPAGGDADSVPQDLIELLEARGSTAASLCADCAAGDVPSPCIGLCRLDRATRDCLGCGRTADEIGAWPTLDPAAKAQIRLRLRNESQPSS